MSARHSSVWITSMSEIGSTRPATWITLSSSKQRTTFTMASVSRMWARNWLPRPSPWLAPATKPSMSTNSTMAGGGGRGGGGGGGGAGAARHRPPPAPPAAAPPHKPTDPKKAERGGQGARGGGGGGGPTVPAIVE